MGEDLKWAFWILYAYSPLHLGALLLIGRLGKRFGIALASVLALALIGIPWSIAGIFYYHSKRFNELTELMMSAEGVNPSMFAEQAANSTQTLFQVPMALTGATVIFYLVLCFRKKN